VTDFTMPLFNTKVKSLPNGFICHQNTISSVKADALYHYLLDECAWQQPKIVIYGKTVSIPRLQCYIADEGLEYQYSGLTMAPEPWSAVLLAIKNRLSHTFGVPFNALLVNWYRDGQDSMGWHSDDEPELGREPCIASLSLGASRLFRMRQKQTLQVYNLQLQSGDCLLMSGRSQLDFQHSLPKQPSVKQGRINLTFRYVLPHHVR